MIINISDNFSNGNNILYLQTALGELFTHTDCVVESYNKDNRSGITIDCRENYLDILKAEISDKVAEVVAINYKYNFFKKNIQVQGLSETEKEILYASLIAADLPEDKKFCYERYKGLSTIAVDGVFNFRLQALKNKWNEIASYMPASFLSSQLQDFVKYLIEKKNKRAYIDCGRVYDSHYRRVKRVELLDGENAKIIREILLSNCGEIEVTGKLPKEDEYYLKQFYGDRVFFVS